MIRARTLKGLHIAAIRTGAPPAQIIANEAAGLLWCTTCRRWQTAASLNSSRSQRAGRSSMCREVNRAYCLAWKRSHPPRTPILDDVEGVGGGAE